ncbi:MAG: hypothetical protein KF781_04270 [Chitinophagaceae bacterium]|nr:hypothetical protein [Chitinophagaceae bacterium]MCW5904700.1 hypothetical protein [Chitinophagaceae bacterium]
MKKIFFLFMMLSAFCNAVFAQENTVIKLVHKVGNQPLQLFTEVYTNQWNEPFTVNRFRYYIADLTIEYANGKKSYTYQKPYHLVMEDDTTTKALLLNKSLYKITSIRFLLGIDSVKNTSGVQTDDLDPMKGMFWTWNTGYIYAKLEGQSDSSKAPAHYFSYHVGGYKHVENAAREIILPVTINTSSAIKEIVIEADILKWFYGENDIKIQQEPICHQPGKLALKLADNYKNMFLITEVK